MRRVKFIFSSFLLLLAFCAVALGSAAMAETRTRHLSTHGDWDAYSFTQDGEKICYMLSTPAKAEGNYTKRGEIYAFITHRPGEGTFNVFSYDTGYPYKRDSNATVRIGGEKFTLFTQGETAWAPDSSVDKEIVNAIRSGMNMIVKGTSRRGTLTTDTFSLNGSSAAHDAISRECGYDH